MKKVLNILLILFLIALNVTAPLPTSAIVSLTEDVDTKTLKELEKTILVF